MFADVAHHTETNQHCLALGLGLIPTRRPDLRGGDNESVSHGDCSQAAMVRWVRRHKRVARTFKIDHKRQYAVCVSTIGYHDAATVYWCRNPLLLVSSVSTRSLWQEYQHQIYQSSSVLFFLLCSKYIRQHLKDHPN